MNVHIMPSFFCSEHCSYCYLGNLRKDKTILSSTILYRQLSKLESFSGITSIKIYGGEITELPDKIIYETVSVCEQFCNNISFVSNLKNYTKLLSYPYKISTSLTPGRTDIKRITRLCKVRPMDVTVVVTPELYDSDVLLSYLPYVNSISFLRYSPSVQNPFWKNWNTDAAYEEYLMRVLSELDISITNRDEILACLEHRYSPFGDNTVFIVPSGDICVIGYKDDLEYFKPIDKLTDITALVAQEMNESVKHGCNNCPFYRHCYAEHIHFRKGSNCCGCKNLLWWYQKNILKNDKPM